MGSSSVDGGDDIRLRGRLRVPSKGSHARVGFQGHYYLPFPVHDLFSLKVGSVHIWHVDQLKTPQGTIDVGLIRYEANWLAPRRWPRPVLPPLAHDLADTVAQACTAT